MFKTRLFSHHIKGKKLPETISINDHSPSLIIPAYTSPNTGFLTPSSFENVKCLTPELGIITTSPQRTFFPIIPSGSSSKTWHAAEIAAEQLLTAVVSAANRRYPSQTAASRARIPSVSTKIMAMQEYPTVLIGAKVSLPNESNISTLARNRD